MNRQIVWSALCLYALCVSFHVRQNILDSSWTFHCLNMFINVDYESGRVEVHCVGDENDEVWVV